MENFFFDFLDPIKQAPPLKCVYRVINIHEFTMILVYFPVCECLGPTRYYKEIGCTPVFKYKGDCCPERYNCDHLKSLPNDKCLLYGREYDVGPFFKNVVRPEDQRPCDGGCYCHLSAEG